MDNLELIFQVEKDTKNTRRYQEEAGDGPPIIGTLYVQQWALRKLTGGDLPERLRLRSSMKALDSARPGLSVARRANIGLKLTSDRGHGWDHAHWAASAIM